MEGRLAVMIHDTEGGIGKITVSLLGNQTSLSTSKWRLVGSILGLPYLPSMPNSMHWHSQVYHTGHNVFFFLGLPPSDLFLLFLIFSSTGTVSEDVPEAEATVRTRFDNCVTTVHAVPNATSGVHWKNVMNTHAPMEDIPIKATKWTKRYASNVTFIS